MSFKKREKEKKENERPPDYPYFNFLTDVPRSLWSKLLKGSAASSGASPRPAEVGDVERRPEISASQCDANLRGAVS